MTGVFRAISCARDASTSAFASEATSWRIASSFARFACDVITAIINGRCSYVSPIFWNVISGERRVSSLK